METIMFNVIEDKNNSLHHKCAKVSSFKNLNLTVETE